MARQLVILTEGGSQVGFGHVVRCTAFASAAQALGANAHMLIHGDEAVGKLTEQTTWEIVDWLAKPAQAAAKIPADALVFIDTYLADLEQIEWFQARFDTVVLDDNSRLSYNHGTVVSPTNFWHLLDWSEKPGLTYLFGSEYVLLRQPFWEVRPTKIQPDVSTVLVTLGGSVLADRLSGILTAVCKAFPDWQMKVVGAAAGLATDRVTVYNGLSATAMIELMQSCDLAVSAAGQTSYELARLGLPAAVVSLAPNQDKCVDAFVEQGYQQSALKWGAEDLVQQLLHDLNKLQAAPLRQKLSSAGQRVVDGQGAMRLAKRLLS